MRKIAVFGFSFLLIVAAAQPALAQQCKPVVGHFEAQVVPPPECTAPFCSAGRVWGGIQGDYTFAMERFEPSLAVPSIFFFTGKSVITLKSGDQLLGTDTGSLDVGPLGGFASLITFTGGTGDMTGATGQIRLRGEITETTTSGDYVGILCKS